VLTVNSSNLRGNTANSGTAAGEIDAGGGGIFAYSALALSQSLVSGNVANSGSGAIQLYAGAGGVFAAGGTVAESIIAFNVVNTGAQIGLLNLYGGGIYDTGAMTVSDSSIAFNNLNTSRSSGQGPGSSASDETGGGIEVAGVQGVLTLNNSAVAANFALDAPSNIHLRDGGQVDPASANNLIGAGGSGGLVNGVNGNVVL
jgi:hypothetical protein